MFNPKDTFDQQAKFYLELLGNFLDEEIPFTPENQPTILGDNLEQGKEIEFANLKREFLARELILIDNKAEYLPLLKQVLGDTIHRLETFNDWATFQTENIDFFINKLQLTAQVRLAALELSKQFNGLNSFEIDQLKPGNWLTFLDVISDDLKLYKKALALSDFINC